MMTKVKGYKKGKASVSLIKVSESTIQSCLINGKKMIMMIS